MFDFGEFFGWDIYYKDVDATTENFYQACENKMQLWNWASPKYDAAFSQFDKLRTIIEGLDRLIIHEVENV
jgi:hypothetical protein